jgi:chemotaxis protein MotB
VKSRRRNKPHASHDRWLVSYADFITLLFAFFVVLYSAAEVNKKKIGQVAAAMQAAFDQFNPSANPQKVAPAPPASSSLPKNPATEHIPDADFRELRVDLEHILASEIARGEADVSLSAEGLVISLREVGFFESGSAEIKPSSRVVLGRVVSLLANRHCKIRIEGHTDNVPVHNLQFHSNWELSTARASGMVRLLVTEYQFEPQSLSAAGFAEYHPISSNGTAKGRALNRRVDVVVLSPGR